MKCVYSGVDTLVVGYKVSHINDVVLEVLERARNVYRESGPHVIDVCGKKFEISAGRVPYRYTLVNNDISVRVARAVRADATPEIMVEYRSHFLLLGVAQVTNQVREWLDRLCTIISDAVSRIDICGDFAGADEYFQTLQQKNIIGKYVNEYDFAECHKRHRQITGYRFGSSDMMVRIYNKTVEMKVHAKEYWADVWLENGADPDVHVWRVEFQLRREKIKQFQVSSIFEVIAVLGDIWRYMSQEWFTVRSRTNDTNPSRWPIARWWRTVVDVVARFGSMTGVVRMLEKRKAATARRLVPGLAGYLTSFAAAAGLAISELGGVVAECAAYAIERGTSLADKIAEKVSRIEGFNYNAPDPFEWIGLQCPEISGPPPEVLAARALQSYLKLDI